MSRLFMDGSPARNLFLFIFLFSYIMAMPTSLSIQSFTARQQCTPN
jgi:hypothetical protein